MSHCIISLDNPILLEALKSNNVTTVKNLLTSHPEFRNRQTFLQAIKSSSPSIIRLVFELCQDPSLIEDQRNFLAFQEALHSDNQFKKQVIKLLLDLGFDPRVRDFSGKTILHWVNIRKFDQNHEIMQILLDHQLSPLNYEDCLGRTPLHYVRDDAKAFLLLLEHGANWNLLSRMGERPACEFDSMNQVYRFFVKLELLNFVPKRLPCVALADPKVAREYFKELRDGVMKDYRAELQDLKGIVINFARKTTLYDTFFMKRARMTRYAKNEVLTEIYENCGRDFRKKYEHFGFLLNLKYRASLRRRELVNEARRNLDSALGMEIPESCGLMIFNCFSFKDEAEKNLAEKPRDPRMDGLRREIRLRNKTLLQCLK